MNVGATLTQDLGTDRLFERASFWLFVICIAWAPFPLGSNRPWSWSLLALLVTAAWLLWCCSVWSKPEVLGRALRKLLGPTILALIVLGWAIVQILPVIPMSWAHPVWRIAAGIMGRSVAPTISVSPWRSETELMKLVVYVMAFFMALVFARESKRASDLINALIMIGAIYAVYGFALKLMEYSQFELFYGMPLGQSHDLTGPFVNRDNYATYEGLIGLCAASRLAWASWQETNVVHLRTQLSGIANYILRRGAVWLVAGVLAFSIVISTGSRGGNIATWAAATAMILIALAIAVRKRRALLGIICALAVLVIGLLLLQMNGASLASRLNEMAANGATDTTRLLLWRDAIAMIHAAPFTGWGLGTYQVVYPLFTRASMPFIMDKAHNDYLELAAGWGLPAAIAWWAMLIWLVGICWRAIFVRRSNRLFPTLGVGASILVGIHSVFDFSLQMPAIALTYAIILGVGVAQAFARHRRNPEGGQP